VVTTDGLITLPIGKGRTGWLQHSSSFPVSQLLKCNVPAIGTRYHTPLRQFFRKCASVYEKERAALAVYIH